MKNRVQVHSGKYFDRSQRINEKLNMCNLWDFICPSVEIHQLITNFPHDKHKLCFNYLAE